LARQVGTLLGGFMVGMHGGVLLHELGAAGPTGLDLVLMRP
jgi:hypothetical protein